MEKWQWFPQSTDDAVPLAVAGGTAALIVWSVVGFLGILAFEPDVALMPGYLIGYVTFVPAVVGLLWGSRWLWSSDIPAKYHWRIAKYWLGGGFGFLVFNAGLMGFYPPDSVWIGISWLRWALSLGMVVGLYIGIAQARSIYHALSAERQSLRATHFEKQRDLVDHLNGILRHEVLNATQAILGNATLLQEANEPIEPGDERLERIRRQGEELTQVIEEVRSLLNTIQDDRELRPVNLTAVLRSEIEKLRDRYPEAEVEATVPEDITVQADELLGRVFGNLLGNAVEHNDGETILIEVSGTVRDGTVVVRIRDDGGGIPDPQLDGLFKRPQQGDHGLGLYLVSQLVTEYDGDIDIVSTGDDGTTVEVALPIVSPEVTAEVVGNRTRPEDDRTPIERSDAGR